MLKALTVGGVRWLTMCQVAWKLGKTPKDWQTGVIIPLYKKAIVKSVQTFEDYHFLAFQERCMPSGSKGNARNSGIKVGR